MSTDSTELTFVRCPSCRSLVPAVSTRCRMCGANLESAGGSGASGDDTSKGEKGGGRVRQRTMSQAEHELASVVEQVRTESSSPIPPLQQQQGAAPQKRESMLIEDPLSAYLEEVEVEEGLVGGQPPKPEPGFPVTPEKNGGAAERVIAEPRAETTKAMERPSLRREEPAAMMRAQSPRPEPLEPDLNEEAQEEKGKLIVESGPRKFGKPSGLSFSKPASPQPEEASPPVRETKREEKREEKRASVGESRREERREEKREERREEKREERREERREQAPQREASPSFSKRTEESGSQGVLVGWFVSYDKPERSAIELRTGKFFISGSKVRPSDLVLSNSSVSSPHALVMIGDGGVIKVQDLMSENGVFVKRADGRSSRELETTTLDHGDAVKFGNVEFVVSLLPKRSGR